MGVHPDAVEIDLFGIRRNLVARELAELLAQKRFPHKVAVFRFAHLRGVEKLAVSLSEFALYLGG